MAVEVKVTANMKKLLGGASMVEASGGTVRDILDDIESRYPGFRESVMNDAQSTAS